MSNAETILSVTTEQRGEGGNIVEYHHTSGDTLLSLESFYLFKEAMVPLKTIDDVGISEGSVAT